MKGKRIGRRERKRKDDEDKILLKNYIVTMKIVNRKYVIVNLKKM